MSSEAQRTELHRTIWKIANDLRGSIDGWDFKTYVLGMLFYRFISENLSAVSIFSPSGEHEHQRSRVIQKLQNFFERFFTLG